MMGGRGSRAAVLWEGGGPGRPYACQKISFTVHCDFGKGEGV